MIAGEDRSTGARAATALIKRIAYAIQTRFPRRYRILHAVRGGHAAPDLIALHDAFQRRDLDSLDRAGIV
jgi:hypothetical protein